MPAIAAHVTRMVATSGCAAISTPPSRASGTRKSTAMPAAGARVTTWVVPPSPAPSRRRLSRGTLSSQSTVKLSARHDRKLSGATYQELRLRRGDEPDHGARAGEGVRVAGREALVVGTRHEA